MKLFPKASGWYMHHAQLFGSVKVLIFCQEQGRSTSQAFETMLRRPQANLCPTSRMVSCPDVFHSTTELPVDDTSKVVGNFF